MDTETRAGVDLVQVLDALVQIVLDGGEGGHYGRGPEPVRDHFSQEKYFFPKVCFL